MTAAYHYTCHKCGKPAKKQSERAPTRKMKHLLIIDQSVYLKIVPIRYICDHCDAHPTTPEQYEWTDHNTMITKGIEE